MRKLLRVLSGYVLAMLAAGTTQVMFAVPPTSAADPASWWNFAGVLILAAATHIAIFSLIFAFVAIAIAEWLGRDTWTYYVLTGLAIALGGFFAEYASENAAQPTIVNNYALVAFATTGAVAGLVYWLVAGHRAQRVRRAAPSGRIAVDPGEGQGQKPARKPEPSRGAPQPPPATAEPAKPMTSVPTTRAPKPQQIRVARAPAAPAGSELPAAKPTTAKA